MTSIGKDPSSFAPGMHDEIDFDAMDQRLSADSNSRNNNLTDEEIVWHIASLALAELLHDIIPRGPTLKPRSLGCQLLAVLHEIDPSLVGGRTLWQIGREIRMSRANLSRIAVNLRDRIGTAGITGHSLNARQRESMRALLVHKGRWATSIAHQRRILMKRSTM